MNISGERELLQGAILGAVLLENRCITINNILTYKNFKNSDTIEYALIWQAIQEMCPTHSIDVITVSDAMYKKHGRRFHYQIMLVTQNVVSGDNIHCHALRLLEIDIREKAIQLCNELAYSNTIHDEKSHLLTVLGQLRSEFSDLKSDLLITLEVLPDFIKNEKLEGCDELLELAENFSKKLEVMKDTSKIISLFNNLVALAKGTTHIPLEVNKLLCVVGICLRDKRYPKGCFEKIHQLNALFQL